MVVQAQGERWKAGAVKAGGEEGAGRRGEGGGEAGGLLLLERGRRGAVSWASGARVQVRQRRRWRPLSTGAGGGLSVQFCGERAVSLGRGMWRGGRGEGRGYLPGTQLFRSVGILRPCRGHICLSSRSSYGLLGSWVRCWPTPGAIRARARPAWRPAWHLR